jgi:mRNA interferase MazF
MKRGEIWWASTGEPSGSEPGYRRPYIIVSANRLNDSDLRTVVTIPLSRKLSREAYPENVRIPAASSGLAHPSVAIVNQVATLNKLVLTERVGRVPNSLMSRIDDGLRVILALE